MKKVYIAGRWTRKTEFAELAEKVKALGHEITASWLYVSDDDNGPEARDKYALIDYEDVLNSNLLIAINEPRGSLNRGGGRHTEFGVAYARGIPCWIVGDKEQIFHHLPGVVQFKTFDDALAKLKVDAYGSDYRHKEPHNAI